MKWSVDSLSGVLFRSPFVSSTLLYACLMPSTVGVLRPLVGILILKMMTDHEAGCSSVSECCS